MNLAKLFKAVVAAAPIVIAYYPQAKAAVKAVKRAVKGSPR